MMTDKSIHSSLWHRVEKLKPRLREDVLIERHVIRDEVWYVVRDRYSTRVHRFSPAVYSVLIRMDGKRSFDRIWREAVEQFGEDAPSQDQILHVASQLYSANVVLSDAPVDERDLAERRRIERSQLMMVNFRNPMFVKIPLFDPDRFLEATQHLVRPLCGWLGGSLWLCAMVWLAFQMAIHWHELTADITDRVLATQSLIIIFLVYPLLKIFHEFGHAYAVKLAGEEVHEMGVMLLTLLPAPYVDASASGIVAGKWQRIIISAAGMMVELAIAAFCMLVWLKAQPGLTRSIAYDTLFIASLSTLVFNGNPLLRFDAYYILSDFLEVPNLGSRSQRYYLYLAQRYLFGAIDVHEPATAKGERFWFALYAPASFIYRMFVLFGIALLIASKYFIIGVGLAIWMLITSIVWPVLKALKFILVSPALATVRWRSISVTAISAAGVVAAIALLPIPNGTVVRGVVWVPEESRVVAKASGRLERLLAEPGAIVAEDDELAKLDDPLIAAKRKKAQARLTEIEARLLSAITRTPFDLQMLGRQRELAEQELAELDRQERNLTILSPASGAFVIPHAVDLADNFVKQGQTIGYVRSDRAPSVHAWVTESEIEYVRDQTKFVSIRFDEAPWIQLDPSEIKREVPASTRSLPTPSLSTDNGGPFALDPTSKSKDMLLEDIFEVEVSLPDKSVVERWGQRVWIRFDHGSSPMMTRFYRAARQLFLGRFHV
jgi:putative peptide zinc metalloprotease protein